MTKEDENHVHVRELKEHIEAYKGFMPYVASAVTIRRVPYELLQANKKYYKPSTATIGPYHALHVSSDSMLESRAVEVNRIKVLRLKRFLERLRPDVTTEAISEKLVSSEMAIRDCYEGVSRYLFDRSRFLEMMLLDGCFIVELLSSGGWNHGEYLMAKSGSVNLVDFELDLLKFENQLPFFFLESLYEMIQHDTTSSAPAFASLADCALSFFSKGVLDGYPFCPIDLSGHSIKHLLHLVMCAFFPPPPSTRKPSHMLFRGYFPGTPASELEAYGVKFRKRNSCFITEIVFGNGVLELPALVLDGSSASLFSNLLATEMHFVVNQEEEHSRPRLVISYVRFMDSLIKDLNDLQILCRAGILECRASDPTKMVSLFRDLSANTFMDMKDFCYADQQNEMHGYCRSVCPQLRAYLKRAYRDWDAFNGILLFILTFTQTLFSILGYSPSSGNNNNNQKKN